MGGGATRWMGVASTPKCKENAYSKSKEREEFGRFDHEFCYQHALVVGSNVTNTVYNTIKARNRSAGKGRKTLPKTLTGARLQAYTGMSEEPIG